MSISNEESIENAINKIRKDFSKFDYLVNCAWVLNIDELWNIEYNKLENLIKINVIAPIILTSKLLDLIKKNNSDIVNIWSTVGFKAYEKQCWYGASKWAMRWINENLQLELKKSKCRVIWFNPWGFKSRIFEKATGIQTDLSPFMESVELAKFIIQILELPKNMEVSKIIINRKAL